MVEMKDSNHEDDVVSEDEILPEDLEIDVEEAEDRADIKLKVLREKLALCDEEKRKYLEDLQRTKADFLNSKRRLEEQLARDKERATDKLIVELLTLVDSFDTAMKNKELWGSIDARWREGVEAIHTKLISILTNNNVLTLNPLGEKFNPEEHEAVSNVSVADDAEIEKIITVLQKGFKRNGTVIRPARVVVGTK